MKTSHEGVGFSNKDYYTEVYVSIIREVQGKMIKRNNRVRFLLPFLTVLIFACKDEHVNDETAIKTGTVFKFVLYDGLSNEITISIRTKLEENARRIKTDLSVQDTGIYTVHIWGNNESFLAAQERLIGQRYPGSTGYVMGPFDMGLLNISGIAENAVHEFVHSVTLQVKINFANNPRWLWEAIALYESGGFIHPRNISYLMSGNYPTLSELNSNYNTGARKIYEVGYLLSEFLKQTWGMEKVVELIKENGNLQLVLSITTAEFEAQWKQYVETKYFGR